MNGGAGTDTVELLGNVAGPSGNVSLTAESIEIADDSYASLQVTLTGNVVATGDVTWEATQFALSGNLDIDADLAGDSSLLLVGPGSGAFSFSGTVADDAGAEDLEITGWGTASLSGTIGVDEDLTVSAGAITSTATITTLDAEFEANDIDLNAEGLLTRRAAQVELHQLTDGRAITIGTDDTVAGGPLGLTDLELDRVTAGGGRDRGCGLGGDDDRQHDHPRQQSPPSDRRGVHGQCRPHADRQPLAGGRGGLDHAGDGNFRSRNLGKRGGQLTARQQPGPIERRSERGRGFPAASSLPPTA